MSYLQSGIRNTVRAVIIHDQKVLLLRKGEDDKGERYTLPGGAQEIGETLQQALIRECQEEIDCLIEIVDLIHVADYFKFRPDPEPHQRHQLELLFQCEIPSSYTPRNGSHPDKHQLDVQWVDLHKLNEIILSPHFIAELISNEQKVDKAVYFKRID